jgi:hypothetical protein
MDPGATARLARAISKALEQFAAELEATAAQPAAPVSSAEQLIVGLAP